MGKLKIGVFGAARGRTMIDVLMMHPDAEVVAICDRYKPLLDKAAERAKEANKTITMYEEFEAFFNHDMDAVVLANYANEHAPYAIRFLRSGRHVLSEVLPCENMAQAVELIEAVEDTGKIYAYAENYLSHTLITARSIFRTTKFVFSTICRRRTLRSRIETAGL